MSEDRYPSNQIESYWRQQWDKDNAFRVDLDDDEGEHKYVLVMFSYPSAAKLHIGHWWNYGPIDTHARYLRMKGYKVFEPMGFDSFGLPAENFAIKVGTHPRTVTEESISYIREQLKQIGAMYDWNWEVVTSHPNYYKWTQWLFQQLFKHGIAVQKDGLVNWSPTLQTVLANEQIINGMDERTGNPVIQKKMTQWYFRITEYAEKLLGGLKEIDWPESTIKRQENWIGRSEGASIEFKVKGDEETKVEVFTTRPDTLFGVSYLTLAPENELLERLTSIRQGPEVREYCERAMRISEVDRSSTTREKTGVFTGSYAINPVNDEVIPIWVSDYVLASYGTGAVMAVPAHDQRDYEFALKFKLPIKLVIRPIDQLIDVEDMTEAFTEPGIMRESGDFSGIMSEAGKKAVTDRLESLNAGKHTVTYRLRDWSVSRQRYWGCPIPMIHCEKCGVVPVPEDQLPVELPHEIKDFRPKGTSPLGALEDWVNTVCPNCGGPAKRDTDTMDTFVCSSFYHLRYLAADRDDVPFDMERMKRWLPISLYVGGPEHGTGHLIYIRFITRFLHEIGWSPVAEPVTRLVHQGIITKDGMRMSKSKGNVVNPDAFIERYGSDVFRMYMMFTGDYRMGGDWSDEGITGIDRFVNRVWRLVLRFTGKAAPNSDLNAKDYPEIIFRTLNNTVKAVGEDLDNLSFNTAISRMMELVNELYKWLGDDGDAGVDHEVIRALLGVLIRTMAPFAPHFCEEAWERLGGKPYVFKQEWPSYDETALVANTITLVVQVNGKLRDRIEAPADTSREDLEKMALASKRVQGYMEGKTLRKVVVVPGKLVNIVVS
ncbi:MAG TPA: leucine--tRNA ligase [Bacteroidetes bacterium]|nr:leucine--tRNA ligase [Bacteroidota bacterium]HEX03901.1 leucine--tRNA ligase [Bacteroidota bacterium]